jgi:hypothetical protein
MQDAAAFLTRHEEVETTAGNKRYVINRNARTVFKCMQVSDSKVIILSSEA